MSDTSHHNGSSRHWLMVVLTLLQTIFLGISGWTLGNIIDQGRTIAALKPTIDLMQASAALAIHRDTYDRDAGRNEEAHKDFKLEMQSVQARIAEMRLQTTKLELQIMERLAKTQP